MFQHQALIAAPNREKEKFHEKANETRSRNFDLRPHVRGISASRRGGFSPHPTPSASA
jgi:hypothetical protein